MALRHRSRHFDHLSRAWLSYDGLNGGRLDRDLQARLGRPVRLANDANCLALSEAADGGYLSLKNVFIDGIQAVSYFFVFNFEYARNPAAA